MRTKLFVCDRSPRGAAGLRGRAQGSAEFRHAGSGGAGTDQGRAGQGQHGPAEGARTAGRTAHRFRRSGRRQERARRISWRDTRRRTRSTRAIADKVTLEVGEDKCPFPIPDRDAVTAAGTATAPRAPKRSSIAGSVRTSWRPSSPAWPMSMRSRSTTCAMCRRIRCSTTPTSLSARRARRTASTGRPAANEPHSPLGEEFVAARAEGYLQAGAPQGLALSWLRLPDAHAAGTQCARRRL